MILRPSIHLSVPSCDRSPTCGGFAADRRAYTTGAVLDRIFIFVVSNPSIYTNMAAANCVVITNGGRYWNSRYRPIACHVLSFRKLRLVVDYLEGSLSVATLR